MKVSRPDMQPRASQTQVVTPFMVDIGGRRLAMCCRGRGLPTVVLETGLGAESGEWGTVQEAVAGFTRVCSYDRAGRGSSHPAQRPRSASQMVEDLRVALRLADLPGPYILVGHSFGGLLMRLFAHQFTSDVRGLILVDAMHEDQFEVLGPLFPPASADEPPVLRDLRLFWTDGWRSPESTVEGIDFISSNAQARGIASLGNLPVHVLTAGTYTNQPLVPPALRPKCQSLWEDLQRSFLRLSSASTQSFVRQSGHFVQRDCPNAIVEAIQTMVKRA